MARALYNVGISTAGAVATIAEFWRSVPLDFETEWGQMRVMNQQTLQLLEERGQLVEQPAETYGWIVHHWEFPMYDLDLSMIKVKLDELRERQRSWSPEFW